MGLYYVVLGIQELSSKYSKLGFVDVEPSRKITISPTEMEISGIKCSYSWDYLLGIYSWGYSGEITMNGIHTDS